MPRYLPLILGGNNAVERMKHMCPTMRDSWYAGKDSSGNVIRTTLLPDRLFDLQLELLAVVNRECSYETEPTNLTTLVTAFNELLDSMKESWIMLPDDHSEYVISADEGLTDVQIDNINKMCPVAMDVKMGNVINEMIEAVYSCAERYAVNQPASTAATVSDFVDDFNDLLEKLQDGGFMSSEPIEEITVLTDAQAQKIDNMCPVAGSELKLGTNIQECQGYINIALNKVAEVQEDSTAATAQAAIADFLSLMEKLEEAGLYFPPEGE